MLDDIADLNHNQIFKVPSIVPKGLLSLPCLLVNASLFGIVLGMQISRARLGKAWIICIWCS